MTRGRGEVHVGGFMQGEEERSKGAFLFFSMKGFSFLVIERHMSDLKIDK